MRLSIRLALLSWAFVTLHSAVRVRSFSLLSSPSLPHIIARQQSCGRWRLFLSAIPRYGPIQDDDQHDNNGRTESTTLSDQQTRDFRQLIDAVVAVSDPQHVPSILTQNVSLILSVMESPQARDLVQSILSDAGDDDKATTEQQQRQQQVAQAIDLVLSFAQDFVDQAAQLDKQCKELLGTILKCMSNRSQTPRQREEALDQLLSTRRLELTAGFLRHLQGERERITNAQRTTTESLRLLETLCVIETRVLEELGQEYLGQAAVVLGQLMGYDTKSERLAVLEAGLLVQGPDFAKELYGLTQEALDGFTRVPGGADPGLVTRVQEVDERLQTFLQEQVEQEDDNDQVGFQ